MNRIKVVIAEDSALIRLLIQDMLSEDEDIIILDTARDGEEVYQKVKKLKPDVLLLDLVMESYDGLYAVKQIMKKCPLPIVILSALGNNEPEKVLEALEAGAYDFVNKPEGVFSSKIRNIKKQLIHKVRLASRSHLRALENKLKYPKNNFKHTFPKYIEQEILIFGASTGGTSALEYILKHLPENIPLPILIVQHIPTTFGFSFARRLEENTPFLVKVIQNNEILRRSTVYIAPSHTNLELQRNTSPENIRAIYTEVKSESYNYPSVDILMCSAAEVYRSKAIGVVLTGMGRDGTKGIQAIFANGGFTIAQDEASSIVFGMPKSAINVGVVKSVLPLREIPHYIVGLLS